MKRKILETMATLNLSQSIADTIYNETRGLPGMGMETLYEELVELIYDSLTENQKDMLEILPGSEREEWIAWIDEVCPLKSP